MRGVDKMQPAKIPKEQPQNESGLFTKRIGSTNYQVAVHFSKTSRETMNDKILRLVKNETVNHEYE